MCVARSRCEAMPSGFLLPLLRRIYRQTPASLDASQNATQLSTMSGEEYPMERAEHIPAYPVDEPGDGIKR